MKWRASCPLKPAQQGLPQPQEAATSEGEGDHWGSGGGELWGLQRLSDSPGPCRAAPLSTGRGPGKAIIPPPPSSPPPGQTKGHRETAE